MAINRSKEWWIARARSEGDMPVGAGVPDAQPTEDALVKHMVDRFLSWRLPEAFHPDGGISFKPTFNERTAYPMKAEPTGTNLFSAEQATAMVRHMLDGSDPTPAAAEARAAPYHFWMNMRRFGSVRPQLTGAEIKTIANANPQSPVYRDVFRRPVEDEPVGDGELVDINDLHFYTLLPATTHRGML